jgi:hypothetical protein
MLMVMLVVDVLNLLYLFEFALLEFALLALTEPSVSASKWMFP